MAVTGWGISGTKERLEGEEALAAAVIARAVADVNSESAPIRREAIRNIADGGLDYWIDILSVRWDIYDAVQEKLQRLIGGDGSVIW